MEMRGRSNDVFFWLFVFFIVFVALAPRPKADTLPMGGLTPGARFPVTVQKVCVPGYSRSVRNVSTRTKRIVYSRYNIVPGSDKFEIDHLISLQLGGSNEISNLWPQSTTTQPWNSLVKDKLEQRLHREICSGRLPIEAAQEMIAKDWVEAYCEYFTDKQKECQDYKEKH